MYDFSMDNKQSYPTFALQHIKRKNVWHLPPRCEHCHSLLKPKTYIRGKKKEGLPVIKTKVYKFNPDKQKANHTAFRISVLVHSDERNVKEKGADPWILF